MRVFIILAIVGFSAAQLQVQVHPQNQQPPALQVQVHPQNPNQRPPVQIQTPTINLPPRQPNFDEQVWQDQPQFPDWLVNNNLWQHEMPEPQPLPEWMNPEWNARPEPPRHHSRPDRPTRPAPEVHEWNQGNSNWNFQPEWIVQQPQQPEWNQWRQPQPEPEWNVQQPNWRQPQPEPEWSPRQEWNIRPEPQPQQPNWRQPQPEPEWNPRQPQQPQWRQPQPEPEWNPRQPQQPQWRQPQPEPEPEWSPRQPQWRQPQPEPQPEWNNQWIQRPQPEPIQPQPPRLPQPPNWLQPSPRQEWRDGVVDARCPVPDDHTGWAVLFPGTSANTFVICWGGKAWPFTCPDNSVFRTEVNACANPGWTPPTPPSRFPNWNNWNMPIMPFNEDEKPEAY